MNSLVLKNKIKTEYLIEKESKRLIKFGLSGLKSFFNAVTNVAWGIASIFLLSAVLIYYQEKYEIGFDAYMSMNFAKLTLFVTEHIMLFFFVFWTFYWFVDYKELKK